MSDMSEREALAIFIEGMRHAEESARVLAHARKQEEWLKVSSLINAVREKATMLAMSGAAQ